MLNAQTTTFIDQLAEKFNLSYTADGDLIQIFYFDDHLVNITKLSNGRFLMVTWTEDSAIEESIPTLQDALEAAGAYLGGVINLCEGDED